ncbi:MAG: hypothetical protein OEZ06_17400 [Myxococcales bacterium]|nr:hypothetical protein [Myxococcales bacterium]
MRFFALLFASAIIAAPGCSGDDAADPSDDAGAVDDAGAPNSSTRSEQPANVQISGGLAAQGCVPGESEACTCDSGLSSVRECLPDGEVGPCECEPWGPGVPDYDFGESSLAGVELVRLPAFDIVADPGRDRLYVSLGSPSPAHENSVVAISCGNAAGDGLGSVDFSLALNEPAGVLAVSDDGSRLHVGARQSFAIVEVDLTTQSELARHPLPTSEFGDPQQAYDLEVVPGNPSRLLAVLSASAQSAQFTELHMFEAGAEVGTPPPTWLDTDEIAVASASVAYAQNTSTTAATLTTLALDASGITPGTRTDNVFSDFSRQLAYDGQWLLLASGQAADPSTHTLMGDYGLRAPLVSDRAGDRVYMVAAPDGSLLEDLELIAFDRDAFTESGRLVLEGISGTPRKLVRCQNGALALIYDPIYDALEQDRLLLMIAPNTLAGL